MTITNATCGDGDPITVPASLIAGLRHGALREAVLAAESFQHRADQWDTPDAYGDIETAKGRFDAHYAVFNLLTMRRRGRGDRKLPHDSAWALLQAADYRIWWVENMLADKPDAAKVRDLGRELADLVQFRDSIASAEVIA